MHTSRTLAVLAGVVFGLTFGAKASAQSPVYRVVGSSPIVLGSAPAMTPVYSSTPSYSSPVYSTPSYSSPVYSTPSMRIAPSYTPSYTPSFTTSYPTLGGSTCPNCRPR